MILAGTGHRPNKLGGYSKEALEKLVNIAIEALQEIKPNKVISGMALGWDQALAIAAYKLDIPFCAAVPFTNQETNWPKESQEAYTRILLKADLVEVICDGGYAPWKMQKRNEFMVDNADVILAMYDGTSGGTANCINYAKSKNKKIINVFDKLKL